MDKETSPEAKTRGWGRSERDEHEESEELISGANFKGLKI